MDKQLKTSATAQPKAAGERERRGGMNEKTKTIPAGETEERFESFIRLLNENFSDSKLFISVTYAESHQQSP